MRKTVARAGRATPSDMLSDAIPLLVRLPLLLAAQTPPEAVPIYTLRRLLVCLPTRDKAKAVAIRLLSAQEDTYTVTAVLADLPPATHMVALVPKVPAAFRLAPARLFKVVLASNMAMGPEQTNTETLNVRLMVRPKKQTSFLLTLVLRAGRHPLPLQILLDAEVLRPLLVATTFSHVAVALATLTLPRPMASPNTLKFIFAPPLTGRPLPFP